MAVGDIVSVAGAPFEETLASASPDVPAGDDPGVRPADDGRRRGGPLQRGQRGGHAGPGELPERVRAAGVGHAGGDRRVGDPKLRAGSYFPPFLEHRRRAERAPASVVATSYLLGVSTRRVEKLAASLGVVGLSK